MAQARIYEFSTGITSELQNGQWVSKGFTVGEYMNKTIEIPQCVETAIRNKWFEVSTSSRNPDPTIVGRVVLKDKAQGGMDWSVVAIVTTGIDDNQRHTDLYRYFLCEGADSLWKIAAYLENYRSNSNYNQFPVHKPAERNRTQPISYNCAKQEYSLPGGLHDFLNNSQTPSLLKPESKYDLNLINAMAEYKAKVMNSQLISWAWNVEALEYPAYFLVIQAANQSAYDSLNNMRQFQASQPRPALGSGGDMAGIESSIKGLIGGGNIKPEWIQTIVQAKQQNQLTEEQWEKIFNDLGANSRSFSANIVRLLTLRAIILPKTLPHYLQYLDIQKPDQNPNQQQQISLQFQENLGSYKDWIKDFLFEGVNYLVKSMYSGQMDIVPAVAWLFNFRNQGLWQQLKHSFVKQVEEGFQKSSRNSRYEPLESLFKTWGKQLYKQDYIRQNTRNEVKATEADMFLNTLLERLTSNWLEGIFQILLLVAFLLLVKDGNVFLFFIFSGVVRLLLNRKQLDRTGKIIVIALMSLLTFVAGIMGNSGDHKVADRGDKTETISPTQTKANRDQNFLSDQTDSTSQTHTISSSVTVTVNIPDQVKTEAIARFDDTRTVLQDIVDELAEELPSLEDSGNDTASKDQEAKKKIVIAALRETLDSNNQFNLQYGAVIEGEVGGDPTKKGYRDKWIEAIYLYQQNKVISLSQGYGFIDPTIPTTTDALKQDITNNPIFQFPTKTKVALEEIVNEDKNKEQTVQKIQTVLKVTKNDYEKAMQGDPGEIKKLVEAIKQYQDPANPSQADGIINPDKDTYKKLKEEVEKLLNPSGQ